MANATIARTSPSRPQDLNDLYLFALVVEHGSFTAAGQAAGLTTSRVSRRVADLEERLGVRLLHRTTRKLALTAIGEQYYQHCRAMVAEAEAAAEVVEQVQASPRGRVRVTCPVSSAQSVLGPIVTAFMQRYPEVRVSLASTDRVVNLIDEGYDVGIRFRATPLDDSSLVARALGESHTYLVASPALLDRLGRPAQPADLGHFPGIGKSRHDIYSWVLKQATLAGHGIAALPDEFCHREIAAGELEIALPAWSLPSAYLYIVYTSRRGLIPAVRAFVVFAAEQLSALCLAGRQTA